MKKVEIKPFRGIFYNLEKVGDLAKVTAPPYDVISPSEMDYYYRLHPFNVIRLILPKGTTGQNKYLWAAQTFEKWQKEDILVRAQRPAIYIYEQKYEINGKTKKTRGFIALLKLVPFEDEIILPHEETLAQPKSDRLNLLRNCRANFSPLFSFFSDASGRVSQILKEGSKSRPYEKVEDPHGVKHSLWEVAERQIYQEISRILTDKTLFLADGHHRYETALNFSQEMKKNTPNFTGHEAFNYVMMMFVDIAYETLTILPTHRLVKKYLSEENVFLKMSRFFHLEALPNLQKTLELMKTNKDHNFGIYLGKNRYYLMSLNKATNIDNFFSKQDSQDLKNLDTAIIQNIVMKEILNIKDFQSEDELEFIQEAAEVVNKVDAGEGRIAFFLNPTKISQVEAIARNHEKMPQKSTYFYPKLLTGLVMNKLEW